MKRLQINKTLFILPWAVLILLAHNSTAPLRALTAIAMDYSIVALDLQTGQPAWESRPDQLGFSYMCLRGEVIEAVWNDKNYRGRKTLIDRRSGKITGSSKGKVGDPCLGHPALEMRQPELTTSDGGMVTRDDTGISYTVRGVTSQLRRFSGHASQMSVIRDLAVFYWWPHPGEVYALDSRTGEVAWRFEGWRLLRPDRWEERITRLFVAGDRVFVFYSASLFCLESTSGKVIWQHKIHLPLLVDGEGADPNVWQIGESFLAVYHEWLYLFDSDGRLAWKYDAGVFGGSFPLLDGDRLYVAARPHARRELREEIIPSEKKALRITRLEDAFLFENVLLQNIPARDPVWSELNRPEIAAGGETIILSFMDTEIYQFDRTWSLDVSSALTHESAIYVRYDSEIDVVRVTVGDEVRSEHAIPLAR